MKLYYLPSNPPEKMYMPLTLENQNLPELQTLPANWYILDVAKKKMLKSLSTNKTTNKTLYVIYWATSIDGNTYKVYSYSVI